MHHRYLRQTSCRHARLIGKTASAFDKKFDIEVPQGLVDEQFNRVWAETEEELKTNPEKFKNPKEQEKAKAELQKSTEGLMLFLHAFRSSGPKVIRPA